MSAKGEKDRQEWKEGRKEGRREGVETVCGRKIRGRKTIQERGRERGRERGIY